MMKIGKEYRFEAAHHLPEHRGKCAQPHGHSYKLEVEVETNELVPIGPPDGGMVMDFADLDRVVEDGMFTLLDHRDLNISAAHLGVERTTVELLCMGIALWLCEIFEQDSTLPGAEVRVSRVRLWETEKCYAEWTP